MEEGKEEKRILSTDRRGQGLTGTEVNEGDSRMSRLRSFRACHFSFPPFEVLFLPGFASTQAGHLTVPAGLFIPPGRHGHAGANLIHQIIQSFGDVFF
jgi:hypothetical protein